METFFQCATYILGLPLILHVAIRFLGEEWLIRSKFGTDVFGAFVIFWVTVNLVLVGLVLPYVLPTVFGKVFSDAPALFSYVLGNVIQIGLLARFRQKHKF